MLEKLTAMAQEGSLRAPKHELIAIDSFQDALARSSDTSRFHEAKLIFKF